MHIRLQSGLGRVGQMRERGFVTDSTLLVSGSPLDDSVEDFDSGANEPGYQSGPQPKYRHCDQNEKSRRDETIGWREPRPLDAD